MFLQSSKRKHMIHIILMFMIYIQGDQLYMIVFLWYLVKSDLSSQCTAAYTGQVTNYRVPEKHVHVYLVGFDIKAGLSKQNSTFAFLC